MTGSPVPTHFEAYMDTIRPYSKTYREMVRELSEAGLPIFRAALSVFASPAAPTRFTLTAAIYEVLRHSLDHAENPQSYRKFLHSETGGLVTAWFAEMVGKRITDNRVMAMAQAELTKTWHLYWQERAGNRVYQVSDGLAMQLKDTELRGLLTDDLRLPYESVYLQIPPYLGFELWNTHTGWHQATGVYLVEDSDLEPGRAWRCLFIGKSKDQNNPLDDALIFFPIPLLEGKTIDTVIEEETIAVSENCKRLVGGSDFIPMVDRWQALFRWCMNVMIYATWPDAEVAHVIANKEARQLWERAQKLPKGPKREKLNKEFRRLDPRNRMYLGSSVTYIDRSKAEEEVGTPRNHRSPEIAVRVQGHWKNQVHGIGRALRKRMWIEPYWRNVDGTPIGQAVHRLGKKEPHDVDTSGGPQTEEDHPG